MTPALVRLGVFVLGVYCVSLHAQSLKDPMRPPPSLWRAPGAAAEEPAPAGPQLQSVMLSPSRRSAIISGQVVNQGERYGDAVLAEVAEDRVVLRRGASTEVLKLYPGGGTKEPRPVKRK
jgi:MSHA biogenesis protein MshK